MAEFFTRLSKSERELLYKKIRKQFSSLSPSGVEEVYKNLKLEYEELKYYADEHKEQEEHYKELKNQMLRAQENVRAEEQRAVENMSPLKKIGALFSTPKYYSSEHNAATGSFYSINEKLNKTEVDTYYEELAERRLIYHKLKVLSELRVGFRAERARSLANAKLNKVRSTSSSLKRKHISRSEGAEECPYCFKLFETAELVLDHIYPVARGGLDVEDNTVLVCKKCNSKKADKTLMIFCTLEKIDFTEVSNRLLKQGKAL